MKFSYIDTIVGIPEIPTLVITGEELFKGLYVQKKSQGNNGEAEERRFNEIRKEFKSFQQCIEIYSAYCGSIFTLTMTPFEYLCKEVGRDGVLLVSCIEVGYDPKFLFRVQNKQGETIIEKPVLMKKI